MVVDRFAATLVQPDMVVPDQTFANVDALFRVMQPMLPQILEQQIVPTLSLGKNEEAIVSVAPINPLALCNDGKNEYEN